MKMFALAGALCLLLSSSTVCKANSGPWCRPDVVTLTFKNQQGGDFARIELRTLNAVCDRNPEKKGFEAGLERSMRIEHNGQWTDVPKECLSVFAFGVDEVSLSGDDAGLGIAIIGKPTERDENLKVTIFKHRDEISCFQVVRCPECRRSARLY